MALPLAIQARYWGIALAIAAALLWFLGDVLLPFVIAGAIAYFLDPVADRLEAMGFSRALSTAIIAFMAVLLFIFLALLVVPTLIQMVSGLLHSELILN